MKFIHVGDTHIGQVYKNETRNNDIKNAFIQMIDYALESKVDFIVHSGDLFDTGNPPLDSLLFVTDQMNRLKKEGIQVFIIPGSHDVGIGEEDSIIELFDRNELLVNLNSKKYLKINDTVELSGITYKGAFICGIKGKRSRVEDEIFKRLRIKEDKSAYIKIFLFHHTISFLGEKFKDLETESLPKGFDYYAAGHWHGHKDNIPYDKGIIQYPGSLEYCDEKEIVDNPNRGFYVVEYNKDGINSIVYKIIKTRKRQIFTINSNNKTPADVEKEIIEKLSKNEGDILVVKIEGKLKGKQAEMNIIKIKNIGYELGYSYISINRSRLSDVEITYETEDIKNEEISTIEEKFLKGRNYSDKEIKIGHFLIESTGEDTEKIKNEVERIFYNDNI